MTTEERIMEMRNGIELLAVQYGLNLTVHDGRIGFVDQEQKKIVALWSPSYTLEKSYFSPEEVRKMSESEIRKNYKAIMDSMKGW